MPLAHTVHELTLKNGAKGLLIDVPGTTVVTYDFYFHAGNYFVPRPEAQQTAHIMEHMTFGATKSYPSIELFSQEFGKNGAYNNASTTQYGMSYVADCALMEWDRILDLQRQAITEPVFTQEYMDAEKGNVTEELTGQANNHGRVLYQAVSRALGSKNFLDAEKLATVPEVTLDDIIAHHARTHSSENLRFCIAGAIGGHEDEISQKLEGWNIPKGELLPIPKVTVASAPPVHIFREDLPSVIFNFRIGLNRRLTEAENDALAALSRILTGTMHSRIWGEARRRGICYGMGSGGVRFEDGISEWEMGGQVRPQNAPELFQLIKDEMQKVRENGVDEHELEEAKTSAVGSFQMRGQTVGSIANWYAGDYFDTGLIDHMENTPDQIRGVERAQITKLVNELFEDGAWTIGVIGNIAKEDVDALHATLAPLFTKQAK